MSEPHVPAPGVRAVPPADPEVVVTGKAPVPRWIGRVFILASISLVPWVVWLAVTLPRRVEARNYRMAWVVFDIGLLAVLGALGILAVRRSPRVEIVASAAATYMAIDAWFDVVTAASDHDFWVALVLALALELPLAALCAWTASHAEQIRREGIRRLWLSSYHPRHDLEHPSARWLLVRQRFRGDAGAAPAEPPQE